MSGASISCRSTESSCILPFAGYTTGGCLSCSSGTVTPDPAAECHCLALVGFGRGMRRAQLVHTQSRIRLELNITEHAAGYTNVRGFRMRRDLRDLKQSVVASHAYSRVKKIAIARFQQSEPIHAPERNPLYRPQLLRTVRHLCVNIRSILVLVLHTYDVLRNTEYILPITAHSSPDSHPVLTSSCRGRSLIGRSRVLITCPAPASYLVLWQHCTSAPRSLYLASIRSTEWS